MGEHANNYAEIAAKDKLTELQLRVRQLVEQVDQIQKEQNYQRVSDLLHISTHTHKLLPSPLLAARGFKAIHMETAESATLIEVHLCLHMKALIMKVFA